MGRKPIEVIYSSNIADNETWNTCSKCGKNWRDKANIPGLIHRTTVCTDCARPTALLDTDIHHAYEWINNTHQHISEFYPHLRIIVADDVKYIICTQPEHLLGLEIQNYLIPTRRDYPEIIVELATLAKTRVRK